MKAFLIVLTIFGFIGTCIFVLISLTAYLAFGGDVPSYWP